MRATHTTTVRRTDSDTMHYGHTGYEAALGYAQHLVDTWDRSRGRITVDIWRIDSDTWVETLGKGIVHENCANGILAKACHNERGDDGTPRCKDCDTAGNDDNHVGSLADYTLQCEACWEGEQSDRDRIERFGIL